MKILLLSPNIIQKRNWGHQLFRNEIGRQADVVYYGKGFKGFNPSFTVQDIISKFYKSKPDIIITYCTADKKFIGLNKVKDIIKVHFILDYVGDMIEVQNKRIRQNKYDIVFAFTQLAMTTFRRSKIINNNMTKVLPFSVDTNIYKDMNLKKDNDVMSVFTVNPKWYPNREGVCALVKSMHINSITDYIIHEEMIKTINRSKIILTSNNIYHSLSMRYTETLACGGFLLADRPTDLELLGLKDRKHLVIYNGINDLKEKIYFYLKHDKERQIIEQQGMNFVRKNHSCKKRVSEMLNYIKEELKI